MPIDEGVPRSSSNLRKELEASQAKLTLLEKENQELAQEVARLRAQVNSFRAQDYERKSALWKKFQTSIDGKINERSQQKQIICPIQPPEQKAVLEKLDLQDMKFDPKQTPSRPTPSQKEACGDKVMILPPPPPLPSKLLCGSKALRRAPEVIELYRSLMKRDAQKSKKTSLPVNLAALAPKNMIGEIENRSTYLSNIKSDVETHGKLISFLSREVEDAAFSDISELETFVKMVDRQLSNLVDERAVLKHFPQWPEKKADALREAACSYRDLKNLQIEVSSYKDNQKQQLTESLRKMQAMQDRVERSVSNFERVREGTSKKYRDLHIPWSWMLDTGLIGQIKVSSLTLAKQYMERITKELKCSEASQIDDLLLQGVRFAYRIHQFAGGFDTDTMHAFEELKRSTRVVEITVMD